MAIERAVSGQIKAATPDPREALKRETVSLMEAADLAGVSRRTVYNWLADGKILGVRNAGGSIRIFADTLFTDIGDLPKKNSVSKLISVK